MLNVAKLLESETRSDHPQFGTKVYLTVCLIARDIQMNFPMLKMNVIFKWERSETQNLTKFFGYMLSSETLF